MPSIRDAEVPGASSNRKARLADELFDRIAHDDQVRMLTAAAALMRGSEPHEDDIMTGRASTSRDGPSTLLFTPAPFEDGSGRKVRGFQIQCAAAGCKIAQTLRANTMSGGPSADLKEERRLMRMFANEGWRVGSRIADHRCKTCIEKERAEAPGKVLHLGTLGRAMQLPAQVPSTPVIAVQDRRIILGKINEVYGDDGYTAGWTDKKVALDLGVPIDHVAFLRKENFGDCASNPGIDELIERATEIEKGFRQRANDLMSEAQKLRDEAAAQHEQANEIKAGIAEVKAALKV